MHTPWYGLQIIQSILQTYDVSPCSSSCLNFSSLLVCYSKGYPDTPLDIWIQLVTQKATQCFCTGAVTLPKWFLKHMGGQLLREVWQPWLTLCGPQFRGASTSVHDIIQHWFASIIRLPGCSWFAVAAVTTFASIHSSQSLERRCIAND